MPNILTDKQVTLRENWKNKLSYQTKKAGKKENNTTNRNMKYLTEQPKILQM
jgi:hypothetical protein